MCVVWGWSAMPTYFLTLYKYTLLQISQDIYNYQPISEVGGMDKNNITTHIGLVFHQQYFSNVIGYFYDAYNYQTFPLFYQPCKFMGPDYGRFCTCRWLSAINKHTVDYKCSHVLFNVTLANNYAEQNFVHNTISFKDEWKSVFYMNEQGFCQWGNILHKLHVLSLAETLYSHC